MPAPQNSDSRTRRPVKSMHVGKRRMRPINGGCLPARWCPTDLPPTCERSKNLRIFAPSALWCFHNYLFVMATRPHSTSATSGRQPPKTDRGACVVHCVNTNGVDQVSTVRQSCQGCAKLAIESAVEDPAAACDRASDRHEWPTRRTWKPDAAFMKCHNIFSCAARYKKKAQRKPVTHNQTRRAAPRGNASRLRAM